MITLSLSFLQAGDTNAHACGKHASKPAALTAQNLAIPFQILRNPAPQPVEGELVAR
jgi:hypothetical protein